MDLPTLQVGDPITHLQVLHEASQAGDFYAGSTTNQTCHKLKATYPARSTLTDQLLEDCVVLRRWRVSLSWLLLTFFTSKRGSKSAKWTLLAFRASVKLEALRFDVFMIEFMRCSKQPTSVGYFG